MSQDTAGNRRSRAEGAPIIKAERRTEPGVMFATCASVREPDGVRGWSIVDRVGPAEG